MKSEYRRIATTDPAIAARAIELADEHVLCVLSSECGGPDKQGWRENHYYSRSARYIRYAAARGLIERHPSKQNLYKVTDAGRAVRPDDGPGFYDTPAGRALLAAEADASRTVAGKKS